MASRPADAAKKPPPSLRAFVIFTLLCAAATAGLCFDGLRDRIRPTDEVAARIVSCSQQKLGRSSLLSLEIDKAPFEVRYSQSTGKPPSMAEAVARACRERISAAFTLQRHKHAAGETFWVLALADASTGQAYLTLEESRAADRDDQRAALPVALFTGGLALFGLWSSLKARARQEQQGANPAGTRTDGGGDAASGSA